MKQILCFGDSNTYGLIPGTENRYNWEIRWTGRLDAAVRGKGYRVIEEGLCGRTTVFEDPLREGRRGTALLGTVLESHKPLELVILMLGTNDCKTVYDASPGVIGKGIERLILQIQEYQPQAKVLLMSPIALGEKVWKKEYDPEFGQKSVETSKALPEVYEDIAKKYKIEFLQASAYAVPSKVDQEHLDEEGHKKLAKAIIQKVEGVIGNGR